MDMHPEPSPTRPKKFEGWAPLRRLTIASSHSIRHTGAIMSISAVNNGGSAIENLFHQRRADFKSMQSAVQSGNITVAQTALAAYQTDIQNLHAQQQSTTPPSSYSGNTKIQSYLSTLTSSIQSGDLTSAQSALKAYQQDRGSLQESYSSGNSASSTGQSGFGQDLVKFIQDSLSGNTSAAQSDAANLTKDLQNSVANNQTTSSTGQVSGAGGHHHHHHHELVQVAATIGTGQTLSSGKGGNDGDDGAGANSGNPAAQLNGSVTNIGNQYQYNMNFFDITSG